MRSGWMICWVLFTVGCTATGCGRGPSFFSGQEKIESAAQWNVLANHVADRVSRELMRQQQLKATVYVRPACGSVGKCSDAASPFDEGFNDLLTTQLVNFGIPTTASAEHADLTLDYKVQTVYHASDFRAWNWPKPGALIALAAGIVVLEDAPWELIAAATAVDMVRANYQTSGHYEVIVTASILNKKQYVMRFSDIYYINSADYWHYRQSGPAQEIRLTGAHAKPPPAEESL